MPSKKSAGLLMFRRRGARVEVLLGHPGGPFWSRRHEGAWTIHKGGADPDESPLDAAIREFSEETGVVPSGPYIPLGEITQRAGKIVQAWAFEGDCDPGTLQSGTTRIEWPPRSGAFVVVPEIDRSAFFEISDARTVLNPAQVELLDRLVRALAGERGISSP